MIGVGADGEDRTVGFRLGKYKGGSCAVVSPSETTNVCSEAKRVVQCFQQFIRSVNVSYYALLTMPNVHPNLTVYVK